MTSPKDLTTVPTTKLQKVLADAGLGSRRALEKWIQAGRVKIDGEIASLGDRVSSHQAISVDGREIVHGEVTAPRILIMNKALGTEVSRKSATGRKTVFSELPNLQTGRWISVGRLDVGTTGLLLFTNHGELAHKLMHPSTNIDREYAVRVRSLIDDETRETMLRGVVLDGVTCRFTDIQYFDGRGSNHWYHVCLMEGRNREVRRLFESQQILVSRLKRVRFGPFVLRNFIPAGRVFEIHADEVNAVCKMLDMPLRARSHTRERSDGKVRSSLLPYPNLDLPNWYSEDF